MLTKKRVKEIAKQYNWTGKDAERASNGLDLQTATEQDLLIALVKFAGTELKQRQYLQRAQKAQATKNKNELERVEKQFQTQIEETQEKINELRSAFLPLIDRLYNFAKPFGLYDPWIEALLTTYKQYLDNQDNQNNSNNDDPNAA